MKTSDRGRTSNVSVEFGCRRDGPVVQSSSKLDSRFEHKRTMYKKDCRIECIVCVPPLFLPTGKGGKRPSYIGHPKDVVLGAPWWRQEHERLKL